MATTLGNFDEAIRYFPAVFVATKGVEQHTLEFDRVANVTGVLLAR